MALAKALKPDAITLDLRLEGLDGWSVLDRLKRDPETRHIPVQVISVIDKQRGSAVGAISYLEKPVTTDALKGAFEHMKHFINRELRELLVVEDDAAQRDSIAQLIANDDVAITAVSSGEDALRALKSKRFDCMVLDLSLPDTTGLELLKKIKRQAQHKELPVVIYTSKDLSAQEERQLKKLASKIIIKDAGSAEKLLDETALFLHRVTSNLSPNQRRIVEELSLRNGSEARSMPADLPPHKMAKIAPRSNDGGELQGVKVLIVDDDVRNIFALTGLLESEGAEVYYNESGKEALTTLHETPGIGLVMMDIMMPEMDGLETTRAIRAEKQFSHLPIIALTAKALEGDREKCLEAGANEYIPKPVDNRHLLDTMKKWAHVAIGAI